MLEKTIILDGFSKTYSMTGWRLGYGVMPEWLAEAVVKLMVNSNSCTASFTQRAGIEALEGPQDSVDTMVAEFKRRRDAIVKGLNSIPGFRCPVPAGAFYVFPNVEGTGMDSKELADYLLYEGGVACLDGQCFGAQGDGYLRLSYANSLRKHSGSGGAHPPGVVEVDCEGLDSHFRGKIGVEHHDPRPHHHRAGKTFRSAVHPGSPNHGVWDVLQWLAAGATEEQILIDYPDLEKDDFPAVYEYAARL